MPKATKSASKNLSPTVVGNSVFIRTVTHYHTGKIASIANGFITLTDAAWVASTGRFSQALKTGIFDEVEPFPGVVDIAIGAIVDVSTWGFVLPREAK